MNLLEFKGAKTQVIKLAGIESRRQARSYLGKPITSNIRISDSTREPLIKEINECDQLTSGMDRDGLEELDQNATADLTQLRKQWVDDLVHRSTMRTAHGIQANGTGIVQPRTMSRSGSKDCLRAIQDLKKQMRDRCRARLHYQESDTMARQLMKLGVLN